MSKQVSKAIDYIYDSNGYYDQKYYFDDTTQNIANLFPFNYSGKTDENGFYLGRDKYGLNIIVDLNKRTDEKNPILFPETLVKVNHIY